MPSCPLNRFYSPAQRARYRDAMARRYSCRAFDGVLDSAVLSALNYAAARVCLPGTRIVIADCSDELFFGLPVVGRIRGMRKCAFLFASRQLSDPRLIAGISGEAFVLEATAMQVGTCWVSGSYRRRNVPVTANEDELLVAVIPLGVPENPKEEIKRHRKSLSQICLSAPAQWPLWAYNAAEAVRIAPSAVNLQPWKLSYSQHALRLMGKKRDSIDMGIALLHMEAAAGDENCCWEWGENGCIAHLLYEEKQ